MNAGAHAPAPAPVLPPQAAPPAEPAAEDFGSRHTADLPRILTDLGISLLVSTYQSGRVIVMRADGDQINTHFKIFPRPMGIAAAAGRLAVGTYQQVWEFHDQPDAAGRLDPPGRHDACFLPRTGHVTGQINVHEIAFAEDGLWITNTRFSCLSVLDGPYSFVPRWKPPFITALAPEDRCHLNGIGLQDGRVRWATALAVSDAPQGWRAGKAAGGVLMEVPSGEIVARGLSMPHSPRWHDGRLWVLESGRGAVATVDPSTGRVERVAELPGFPRGLAFAGGCAFVGLSKVRETNAFGGIPLTERLEERLCGVWVLEVRTGRVLGSLQFDGLVQEIFDVQVLRGCRFPELAEPESTLAGSSFILPPQRYDMPA